MRGARERRGERQRAVGRDYREVTRLMDGTPVTLRAVSPGDRALLLEGFDRLSPDSRYRRFFVVKSRLEESEVRYLTELDYERHVAIGALLGAPPGPLRPAGVGRFVRIEGAPDTAEVAVTVLDEVQGRGLGHLLLRRLEVAARERGVRRFRFEVQADNAPMLTLVHHCYERVAVRHQDNVVILDATLG